MAVLIVAVLAVAGCTSAPSKTSAGGGSGAPNFRVPPVHGLAPGTQLTPLAASTLTTPQAVTATDGKVHLTYELVLTTTIGVSIRLDQLEVRDAGSQRPVATLAGDALLAALTPTSEATSAEGTDDPT
ncbi:MAG: hypothetical protein JO147_13760, partial [Actinobacteria bacterium]|nr:hypothetical protein [Actinomycetota bacterium]